MKALVGRDSDGWSTRGFVARLESGQLLTAASAEEMVRQLRGAGVDAIAVSGSEEGDRALSTTLQQSLLEAWQQATSRDPQDRFGIPESAFRAARESHGLDNPTIRSGMYVPTRGEVATKSPEWLFQTLIDWMWESPSELIPNSAQIANVRAVLLARPDATDPAIVRIIAECDEYLACGS
jgi:hypothetical protein